MNLGKKKVWDLTLDEIEYVYNNLHMNNYVYAALNTFHKSNIPLNKLVKLRTKKIPSCLIEYAQKLID